MSRTRAADETGAVALARQAAAEGDWQQAYSRLAEVELGAGLALEDLPLLAAVAYNAGRVDVTVQTWERAHAERLRAGDVEAAAEAATQVAFHLLVDAAMLAPVRGWVARAQRLLENREESALHAWVAVVHSEERLLSGDFETCRTWARRAIELGERHKAPAAAAMGAVAEGRSLILDSEVARGVALLEEAALTALSGGIEPLTKGIIYCEVLCGLQAVGQFDKAEQWTDAMERWHPGQPVGSIHGRCRVHKAEVLRLRGDCAEAEREILSACEELRPFLRRELGWPLTELGRIRFRLGDLDGAEEAFLAAREAGWDPQPGLALVMLARGDVAQASASIRDALDHPAHVPSKEWPPNSDLRRSPLLEAEVQVAIAAGEPARAGEAATELAGIATRFESAALTASSDVAAGRVARAMGDPDAARHHFERAIELWSKIGAPYETAEARLELGQAHRSAGNEQQARLELSAARNAFEGIGAPQQTAAAAQLLDFDGAGARDTAGAVTAGPEVARRASFIREGDFWSVEFEGRTIRLRDAKGLQYIVRLLSDPGREFHALDLVSAGTPRRESPAPDRIDYAATTFENGSDLLDTRAKESYRRRLIEIDEDIDEARRLGDLERGAQATAERDFLIRELARAVGLHGRGRRTGSASERARVSVTRALRRELTRIGEHDAGLGAHLNHSVRTGTYCAYCPDPRLRLEWTL